MEKELVYRLSLEINADIAKVWDALINPEMTSQYMFGCAAISDWKIGSDLTWKGISDGVEYVKGKVVEYEPMRTLAYTTYNPFTDTADDYHLTGKYTLTDLDGRTRLDITQGDFLKTKDSEKRYAETQKSWEMTMNTFKQLLEE